MIKNRKILAFLVFISYINSVDTCTGIRLKARDGSVIYARTLEFNQELNSEILFTPRNYNFQGASPYKNKRGLPWKAHYAVVGANALGTTAFVDGINEMGLAGGLFYFPDYAQYQNVTPENVRDSIASWQVLTWILTTCGTIQEVKDKLKLIKVSAAPINGDIQPVHYIIHDPQGGCVVIEYTHGKLRIYDNSLGVITNSPGFDWHVTNLRNYVNLSAINVPKVKLPNIMLTPVGQGSGMLGLPGDFTPPSRFIRAVAFSSSVISGATGNDALNAAFHVLNLFDIPKGVVRGADNIFDRTQWTSAINLTTQEYYYHTYDNRQIFKVRLPALKRAKNKIVIPMEYKPCIIDITPKNTQAYKIIK